MTDITPNQQLPYPEPTDPVSDYPAVAKQMADLLDLVLPPVGAIIAYASATAPDGWFLCDGATFDPDQYPKLAAVLNGIVVPDLRGRFILSSGGTGRALPNIGQTGGHQEMQTHKHTLTGAEVHGRHEPVNWEFATSSGGSGTYADVYRTVGMNDAGSGDSGNMPPFYVLAYIIRNGETS